MVYLKSELSFNPLQHHFVGRLTSPWFCKCIRLTEKVMAKPEEPNEGTRATDLDAIPGTLMGNEL